MNFQKTRLRYITLCLVLVATLWLTGCSDMSPTTQRTLSGGAIGAGGGAVIGAIAGNAGMGAAIGGAQKRRPGNEVAAPRGPLSAFPSLTQEWQQGRGGPPPPAGGAIDRSNAAGVQK